MRATAVIGPKPNVVAPAKLAPIIVAVRRFVRAKNVVPTAVEESAALAITVASEGYANVKFSSSPSKSTANSARIPSSTKNPIPTSN